MTTQIAMFLLLSAQSGQFEVATVRPGGEQPAMWGRSSSGNRVKWTWSNLTDLVCEAYNMRYDQVSGGAPWANSEHFDVVIQGEGDARLSEDQIRAMLRNLLGERFQLKVHRETRVLPVYLLVVGNTGGKLHSPDATGSGMSIRVGPQGTHIAARQATMQRLAVALTSGAGRPVIDRTGLDGQFSFTLDFVPDTAAEADLPGLITAVQEQLGLRLEPAKAPIDVLVIDEAARPSAN